MRNSNITSVVEINEYWDSLDYEAFEDSETEDSEEIEFSEEIEDSENEDSEEIEDSDNEDSEVSEDDVQIIGLDFENETSIESGNGSFKPNYDLHGDFLSETKSEISDPSSYDYTIAFEDLQTVGIFTIALLFGLLLGSAFIKGLSHKNEC